MIDDRQLLGDYLDNGSESSFEQLVQRHSGMIYAAALRQVNGDVHLARDVTQSVVIDLARKARRLRKLRSLSGWFYTATRYAAAKAVRSEQRRRCREQESETSITPNAMIAGQQSQQELAGILDEALHDLNENDREVVVLRFFEKAPLAEIGELMGVSPDAARMRIERAMEKLRQAFARRGVTTGSGALAGLLAGQALSAAPAGVVSGACTAVLTSAAASAGAGTALSTAGIAKLAGAVALTGAITAMVTHQFHQQDAAVLQERNDFLHQNNERLTTDNAALQVLSERQKERIDRLESDVEEIHRLRGLVGELRLEVERLAAQADDPGTAQDLLSEAESLSEPASVPLENDYEAYREKQAQKENTLKALHQIYHSLQSGWTERFPMLMNRFEEQLLISDPQLNPDLLPSRFQLVFTNEPTWQDLTNINNIPFLIEREPSFRGEAVEVSTSPNVYVTLDGKFVTWPLTPELAESHSDRTGVELVPRTATNYIAAGWERMYMTLSGGIGSVFVEGPPTEPMTDEEFRAQLGW